MPRPTSSTTLQRPELAQIAWEIIVDGGADRGFVGTQVMPVFVVPEQSMDYPKIPLEAIIKEVDLRRAPRSDFARDDWEFETGTFKAQEYSFEHVIDDVEAALYSRYFDAEEVGAVIVADKILRAHENRVVSVLETGAADLNVTVEWDNAATATPQADVDAGKTAMRTSRGILPNAIAMGWSVFNKVLLTAELKEAFKYTNPIEIGAMEAKRNLLAQYFGVDQVIVGNAQRDTSKKAQTTVLADIWDDEYVHLLAVSGGGNSLREPVIGRTFMWDVFGGGDSVLSMESYRQEEIASDVIRGRSYTDEAIIFSGAKFKLGNITT